MTHFGDDPKWNRNGSRLDTHNGDVIENTARSTWDRSSRAGLYLSLLVIFFVFGVRAAYAPSVYYLLVAAQVALLFLTAWKVGLRLVVTQEEKKRMLATSGGLLIAPWVVFSLLAGYGRPDEATHIENQLRYLILLINSIAVAGGLVMLRQTLAGAGDRFYSTLGLISIAFATPLYLIWAAMLIQIHRVLQVSSPGEVPSWITATADFSDILLFFGSVLTYLATAAFAWSLTRTNLIRRNAARAIVVVAFVAVVCLSARGLQFPDPAVVFEHKYMIPGWVFGIPAIPWIMPCLLGVTLLKRAAD